MTAISAGSRVSIGVKNAVRSRSVRVNIPLVLEGDDKFTGGRVNDVHLTLVVSVLFSLLLSHEASFAGVKLVANKKSAVRVAGCNERKGNELLGARGPY